MKKALALIIIVSAIAAGVFYFYKQELPEIFRSENSQEQQPGTPVTITSEEMREKNFTGSRAVIAGDSRLAKTAREYVENLVVEFAAQADAAVPEMREDWGEDSPAASFSIEIGAKLVESKETQSIIITEYMYTGGAHGSSSYKVFTASKESGELLSLSDIFKEGSEAAFTELTQKKLNGFRPSGSETAVVFPEDVAGLSFGSFRNWALDNDSLILYFAQYEVAPGVVGAFELPIPRTELGEILR